MIEIETNRQQLRGLIRLTRWRHHVPFVVPLTITGAMLALDRQGIDPDWRLLAVMLANLLAMASAFIINDIADADDDARDPAKAAKNVISSGALDKGFALRSFWFIAAASAALYAMGSLWSFVLGVTMIATGYAYSVAPLRLKARPIVDVISHAFGAGSLPLITGYFLYDNNPGPAWLVIIGMTLISAYGQFYNQIDDFNVDREAGLNNTSQLLGKAPATVLMYAVEVIAIGSFAAALVAGVFPEWLWTVVAVTALACALFVWKHDMRGREGSGFDAVQVPALLTLNVAALLWLAWALQLLPMTTA